MQVYKRARPGLGSLLELRVEAPEQNPKAEEIYAGMSEAFAEAFRLETKFSFFESRSELSMINRAPIGVATEMSEEMTQVLHYGQIFEAQSQAGWGFRLMPRCSHGVGKCFALDKKSVTRLSPCRIDLGGIAKGFIVDRVFDKLRGKFPGLKIVVNAGGDLRCQGTHQVEIRVPNCGTEKRYQIQVKNSAIATSSKLGPCVAVGNASARYPRQANAEAADENGISSVSVIAQNCALADGLTKLALFSTDYSATQLTSDFSGLLGIYAFDQNGQLRH